MNVTYLVLFHFFTGASGAGAPVGGPFPHYVRLWHSGGLRVQEW